MFSVFEAIPNIFTDVPFYADADEEMLEDRIFSEVATLVPGKDFQSTVATVRKDFPETWLWLASVRFAISSAINKLIDIVYPLSRIHSPSVQ